MEEVQSEVQVVEGNALTAITEGEINMQIATAKKWPRVLSKVREKIFELATIDKETAEKCWYALPRDGKIIQGPSVRLAEIVVSSYQNLRAGTRQISEDDKTVTCQAVCMDLENNVAIQTEVKRRIVGKNGRRYSDDMIITTTNAGCSIALRNAIFKVVPMALFKAVLDRVKKVGMGNERTFVETRRAACEKFKSLGVKQQQICDLLGVRAENDMTMEHVATLMGLLTAIEEGTTTVEETFAAQTGKPVVDMPTEKPAQEAAPGQAGPAVEQPKPESKTTTNGKKLADDGKIMDERQFHVTIGTIMPKLAKVGITEAKLPMRLVSGGFVGDLQQTPAEDRKRVIAYLESLVK